jgi:hypothetical protein
MPADNKSFEADIASSSLDRRDTCSSTAELDPTRLEQCISGPGVGGFRRGSNGLGRESAESLKESAFTCEEESGNTDLRT